jgi:hypothetical protein
VRASLLKAWPVLSKEFGVHPWDVPNLSKAEIAQYLDAANEIARQAERASRR